MFKRAIEAWTGLARLQKIIQEERGSTSIRFVERVAEQFGIESELKGAPIVGPLRSTVFLSNHPTGALDFLAIYPKLFPFAPGLKVVANRDLLQIAPLRDVLIGVHTISTGKRNAEASGEIARHLRGGGNILIFPAGKIGGWRRGKIIDRPWRTGVAKIILENALQAIPVYIDARNGRLFYVLRELAPRLGLLILLRSLHRYRGGKTRVHLGPSILRDSLPQNTSDAARALRDAHDALSS